MATAPSLALVADDDLERKVAAIVRSSRERSSVGNHDEAEAALRRVIKLLRESLIGAGLSTTQLSTSVSQSGTDFLTSTATAPSDGASLSNSDASRRLRLRLLAAALVTTAAVQKAAGRLQKAVRSAHEAYDLENDIGVSSPHTPLSLCALYTAAGKFDKAVEAADAARRRLEQSGNREPLLWAALHYNRTNAQYHQLTTVGAGQASDVFAGFQLAKSFAREAGEQGSSLLAHIDDASATVLQQFAPRPPPALPAAAAQPTTVAAGAGNMHAASKSITRGRRKVRSSGRVPSYLPAIYKQRAVPKPPTKTRDSTKKLVRPPPPQAARAATADSEARRPVPAAIVSVPAASARNERPRNDDDEERAAATEFKSAPVTLVSASPATKVDGTEHAENQPRSKLSGATQPVSGGTEAETTVPLVIASPSPPPSSYQSRDASPLSNYSSNHTTPRSHAGANQTPGSSFTRHLSDRQKAASFDRHRSSPRAGPADTAATDEPAFLSMSNDGSVKYEDDFDFDA
jgi:hypothetical protein